MTKSKIKKLAQQSYRGISIDKKRVNAISSLLSRADLKLYVSALKAMENKKNLIVSIPFTGRPVDAIKKIFPNKVIVYKKDESLMLGVKIIDNDVIYEFTLKNTLDNIISHIKQNYD